MSPLASILVTVGAATTLLQPDGRPSNQRSKRCARSHDGFGNGFPG
jgi:hypothetical protein